MSQTNGTISQSVLANTLTLSNSFQQLFSYQINNSMLVINMNDGTNNLGSVLFFISGGVALQITFTGSLYFSGSDNLTYLPISYSVSTSLNNYTIWFEYVDNVIQVSNSPGDPNVSVNFVGTFTSATDLFDVNTYAADFFIENNSGSGITFPNDVYFNGGVTNIGTSGSDKKAINISTNSAFGGRLCTIGNTISGSSVVLAGVIETPNPPQDTITYSSSAPITWTDIASTAQRIGKVCNIVVQANLTANEDLTAGTIYDFFSVTPTIKYTTSYVQVGHAFETSNNTISAIISQASSATFQLIMPVNLTNGSTITISASISYIST